MTSRFIKNVVLAFALASVGTFVAPATDAMATSLAPLTVEQMTDVSDYVLRGEVTEVWTEIGDNGRVWTRARVSVNEILKGPDAPTEVIVDSMGGTVAGHTTTVSGQAVFSEHEDLIAFLSLQQSGRLVPVAKFLGKFSVRRAPNSDRSHVMQWHPNNNWEFDARFLPHPAPEKREYLDDLLTRVNARVAAGWDGQPIPGASTAKLEKVNTPLYRTHR